MMRNISRGNVNFMKIAFSRRRPSDHPGILRGQSEAFLSSHASLFHMWELMKEKKHVRIDKSSLQASSVHPSVAYVVFEDPKFQVFKFRLKGV